MFCKRRFRKQVFPCNRVQFSQSSLSVNSSDIICICWLYKLQQLVNFLQRWAEHLRMEYNSSIYEWNDPPRESISFWSSKVNWDSVVWGSDHPFFAPSGGESILLITIGESQLPGRGFKFRRSNPAGSSPALTTSWSCFTVTSSSTPQPRLRKVLTLLCSVWNNCL